MSTLAFPDAVLTPLVYLTVIFALCVRNQPLVTGELMRYSTHR